MLQCYNSILFPRCRIPVIIRDNLSCVTVQANHTHYYKVERVEKGETSHHPDADKFRADAPGYNQGSKEACHTSFMLEYIK